MKRLAPVTEYGLYGQPLEEVGTKKIESCLFQRLEG